jgi:class 3 adenylate cyclase
VDIDPRSTSEREHERDVFVAPGLHVAIGDGESRRLVGLLERVGTDPGPTPRAGRAVNMLMQVPTLSQIRTRSSRETEFDTFRLAVGFLDLVGFTELSGRLATSELAAAVEDFERDAVAVIATSGGRLVKSIGDELMFVAHSPDEACTVALELCEHVSRHPVLTELRGAVAFGDLLGRDGDYYGPTVNLAARALSLAPAGSIVTDRPIDGFTCRPLGPQQLRSIAPPVELWVLSR